MHSMYTSAGPDTCQARSSCQSVLSITTRSLQRRGEFVKQNVDGVGPRDDNKAACNSHPIVTIPVAGPRTSPTRHNRQEGEELADVDEEDQLSYLHVTPGLVRQWIVG